MNTLITNKGTDERPNTGTKERTKGQGNQQINDKENEKDLQSKNDSISQANTTMQ